MTDFIARRTDEKKFLGQLKRYCEKLRVEKDWSSIPKPYVLGDRVHDGYGRTAIVFAKDGGWAPAIALQFLYDGSDHQLEFLDASKGIDLALRIQANPVQRQSLNDLLRLLRAKAETLEKADATVNVRESKGGNRHTLLIARRSLGDVIKHKKTDEEQVEAIYEQLHSWCCALFSDSSQLLKEFSKLDPYD